jgi:hypothetical protein
MIQRMAKKRNWSKDGRLSPAGGLVAEFAASRELFPGSQSGNGLRQSLNHRLARILRDRDSAYGVVFIRRLTAKASGSPKLSSIALAKWVHERFISTVRADFRHRALRLG